MHVSLFSPMSCLMYRLTWISRPGPPHQRPVASSLAALQPAVEGEELRAWFGVRVLLLTPPAWGKLWARASVSSGSRLASVCNPPVVSVSTSGVVQRANRPRNFTRERPADITWTAGWAERFRRISTQKILRMDRAARKRKAQTLDSGACTHGFSSVRLARGVSSCPCTIY